MADTRTHCTSGQFVVVAAGDGNADLASEREVARARALPFLRRIQHGVPHTRLDAVYLIGPSVQDVSTLVILCPTDRMPPQATF